MTRYVKHNALTCLAPALTYRASPPMIGTRQGGEPRGWQTTSFRTIVCLRSSVAEGWVSFIRPRIPRSGGSLP
jgi:hypothetical protein